MENSPIPVLRNASLSNVGNLFSSSLSASQVSKPPGVQSIARYFFLVFVFPMLKLKSSGSCIHSSSPKQQQQPPEFPLGGASRLWCRKLPRSLHLSWTCLHGLVVPGCLLLAATKIKSGSQETSRGFRSHGTVPREECLMECWSPLQTLAHSASTVTITRVRVSVTAREFLNLLPPAPSGYISLTEPLDYQTFKKNKKVNIISCHIIEKSY